MRKDLLDAYLAEKERHRAEKQRIERARKSVRGWLRRLFGKLRVQKEQEMEEEYVQIIQDEGE